MRRFVTAILIAIVSTAVAKTNPPAKLTETQALLTEAETLLAAMQALEKTNAPAAPVASEKTNATGAVDATHAPEPVVSNPVPSEEELKARLELVRTLRFQKSFDM